MKDYLKEQFYINPILCSDLDGEPDDSIIDVLREKIFLSPPLGTSEDTWNKICNKVISEWFCKKRGTVANVSIYKIYLYILMTVLGPQVFQTCL